MKVALAGIASVAVFATAGHAASDPINDVLRRELARFVVKDTSLQRENKTLRRKLRKARRANKMHAAWVRRLQAANRDALEFGSSGVVRGFLCVHHFEGAWNARTGNGYENGLQMDKTFQRTYGAEWLRWLGPSWSWPPFIQVTVGMRAYYSGRGWHPWPNTARKCGLL